MALGTDEKTIKLNAVPMCRHKLSGAANTQHNVAPHPSPPSRDTKPLTLSVRKYAIYALVKCLCLDKLSSSRAYVLIFITNFF